ncbi:MAG TPA: MFS transporter [Limnobacter sp.]|uniref:AmpG family muropeptide MFS transporter n=1 Tax=Limnobacter sp. TaxID=2003368 RepID=UPI002E31E30F|nr:MFS transporter [Limnobacter sp.]HEX5486321.1 MFS transporter [Limnobacter sp.]
MPPLRLISILILGFSSGLPLALSGSTLQAWLSVENIDIKTIGLYAIVGMPYTYKFLWSPLLDYLQPGFLDRRRGWILIMQLVCAGLLCVMATLDVHNAWQVAAVAMGVALCSATQDMAIDAYRTELLPEEERGLGAAYYVAGYRVAMLTSGGLALILAGQWLGWRGTYFLMGALMVAGAVATALSPAVSGQTHSNTRGPSLSEIVKDSTKDFLTKDSAIWILILIVLYKIGDAFAGSLSTAFLLRGLGFTLTEVGTVNKTVSLVATLGGAFIGGHLMKKMGLFRSLLVFGILQGLSNLSFWALSLFPAHVYSMAAAVFVENLCGGMGTAAFVGLLTTLCSRQFSATQYALLSSLAAVGRVYLSAPAGYLVAATSWGTFFLFSTAAAAPGLLLLVFLKKSIDKLTIHHA